MYKLHNKAGTEVVDLLNGGTIAEGGYGWEKYQEWLAEGNTPEPFTNMAELRKNCLASCKSAYEKILMFNGILDQINQSKSGIKLAKAMRKELKGSASAKDLKVLDDNDAIDAWLDEMELALQGPILGTEWIEHPDRTMQDLEEYDPSLISWPVYPIGV